MPNTPRFTLPPVLAARVEALRAAAPAGRPTRQAVVEAALGAGLGVLEAPLSTMGEHHAREAFATLVADLEVLAAGVGGAYWEALRLARRRAGEAVRGREDAGWASDAPTGQPVGTNADAYKDHLRQCPSCLMCDLCADGMALLGQAAPCVCGGDGHRGDKGVPCSPTCVLWASGAVAGPKPAPTPADAPSGPTAPALARRVARRHRPVPCPLDPRFLAWQAAAERFVASLDPANHGRSGPLHCAWEGRYLGGYTSLDVCDGAATTGGNIEADWIRPWGAGDESTIRDWLGEAERRPWDMGIACDGCRGLATVRGAR